MEEMKFCNTTIIVGPEKKAFNVNRVFLAQASPVFEAMLYHCQKNGEIVLENVACDVFESALRSCYCSDPEVTQNNVVGVIEFADKYQMDGLLRWARDCLRFCLENDNFCILFSEAVDKNQRQSIAICNEFIGDKRSGFVKIFESADFGEMSVVAMRELIKMDEIRLCEQELWNYLVKWARVETDLDADEKYGDDDDDVKISRLRAVYDLVRFGLMTNEFIASRIVPENVLSDKEIVSVFVFINGGSDDCGPFNAAKRKEPSETKPSWREWKKTLKVGMKVDVYDYSAREWCQASINNVVYVESRDGEVVLHVDYTITKGPWRGHDSISSVKKEDDGWVQPLGTHTQN